MFSLPFHVNSLALSRTVSSNILLLLLLLLLLLVVVVVVVVALLFLLISFFFFRENKTWLSSESSASSHDVSSHISSEKYKMKIEMSSAAVRITCNTLRVKDGRDKT